MLIGDNKPIPIKNVHGLKFGEDFTYFIFMILVKRHGGTIDFVDADLQIGNGVAH